MKRFRIYLEKKKLWDDKKQEALDERVKKEINDAIAEMDEKSAKAESVLELNFDNVFAAKHPSIEKQRAEFRAALPYQKEGGDA
ncbi:MAG: hypothetical protein M5R36_06865 [Deltaproteobacteria bacterium]|nr:hypothetical protein [Deltaproteobacteria bacterium]